MGRLLNDEVMEKEELELFHFCQKNCIYRPRVKYGEPHLLRWVNGGTVHDSRSQFYLHRATMNPRMVEIIGKLFWEKVWDIWETQRFQICGIESCSIPIVLGIGYAGMWLQRSILGSPSYHNYKFDINSFFVRRERKLYGLENWTEGIIEPGTPIMLVDDATNSKAQMSRAHTILTELGHEVLPTAFSFMRFDRNEGTLPVTDVRYIFKRADFATNHGEPWPVGSFDYEPDLEIDFSRPEPNFPDEYEEEDNVEKPDGETAE